MAGLITVLLGIAFVSLDEQRSALARMLGAVAAAIGMTALYLTQVRSLTVMAALSVLIFAAIRLRQGRILQGGWIAAGGVAIVAASFMWAAAIGGQAVEDRFSSLIETGLFTTFQEKRGLFLDYTVRELLFQFPLGGGPGPLGNDAGLFQRSCDVARAADPRRDSDHRLAARRRLPDVAVLRRRPGGGRQAGVRVRRRSFN